MCYLSLSLTLTHSLDTFPFNTINVTVLVVHFWLGETSKYLVSRYTLMRVEAKCGKALSNLFSFCSWLKRAMQVSESAQAEQII